MRHDRRVPELLSAARASFFHSKLLARCSHSSRRTAAAGHLRSGGDTTLVTLRGAATFRSALAPCSARGQRGQSRAPPEADCGLGRAREHCPPSPLRRARTGSHGGAREKPEPHIGRPPRLGTCNATRPGPAPRAASSSARADRAILPPRASARSAPSSFHSCPPPATRTQSRAAWTSCFANRAAARSAHAECPR